MGARLEGLQTLTLGFIWKNGYTESGPCPHASWLQPVALPLSWMEQLQVRQELLET